MTCSQCLGIEREFDRRTAQDSLRRYRRRGPADSTRILIEGIVREGVGDRTLLDIGGGVGAIQYALLEAGAARTTSVDASTAYLEAAGEEAERRGLASRITAIHGDFVAVADTVPRADVVTLDRVICCYHDMRSLVGRSAARAGKLYGIVYPRDTWWLRPALAMGNLIFRVRRSPFRVFLHATSEIESILAGLGFSCRMSRTSGVWQVALYAAAAG